MCFSLKAAFVSSWTLQWLHGVGLKFKKGEDNGHSATSIGLNGAVLESVFLGITRKEMDTNDKLIPVLVTCKHCPGDRREEESLIFDFLFVAVVLNVTF